ncbi:3-hydroxyacyl-CoA dehydrogenase family protein [Arsenicicoccus sp. oral taxon 190]|uniref:3-hydroxyacyl-CoA dehydrogenase family protein n=1 Tax=Arsenicicoccus sp. oral taxon 190 TaxID=1658671 RepID=UPI00067A323E|nr:3-hydroxybutyryl-CoA dehydrogenase [Arsenicicoccus sp. oral taxon 190]AKT52356.1 3-hydroxybutyryl-CoA dehydrogenase [Arsenicicoccus sp. oral taxon 190]
MERAVDNIGVVGLGTMGAGIVEVCARHGLRVVAVDMDDAAVERGRGHVERSTGRAVERGKLGADEQQELLGRITFAASLDALADCDLVLEAVPEVLEIKRELFGRLDQVVPDACILATNTSSLSVTEISVATSHPERVVGLHFFNPAPVQKLVEIISTVVTDPDVVTAVRALAERLGKTPVVVGDKAGFIGNYLLFGYLNHAMSMYESRYATREDLDAAMQFGCGYPMGPLALLDLIGLDTAYQVLDTMYRQGRDKLHAPSPILKQMVTAGLLGRKTGRGFYTYDAPGSGTVVPDAQTPAADTGTAPTREVRSVGVVGTGTMATGIVEVFAKAGYPVTVVGRSDDKVAGVTAAITASLDKAISKGKATPASKEEALRQVTGATDVTALADVDLVVEAIAEDVEVKTAMFRRLDEVCRPGAILATTTSSLPVIQVAAATSRPADVVGLHFFNPAQVMKLVEVVSTVSTAADVEETAVQLCRALGKVPVRCGDRAGFIVNALLFPYLNDAVKMLEAHYATADDIDTAMKNGCALPMGPFELLDVVGLDVSYAIQRQLYLEFRDRGYAPAPLLEHMVTAGYLGRKTRRGFRTY